MLRKTTLGSLPGKFLPLFRQKLDSGEAHHFRMFSCGWAAFWEGIEEAEVQNMWGEKKAKDWMGNT